MAHDIRIVTEAQLRQVVELDLTAIDVVEKAFAALASGKVVMPPILSMDLPDANGEVDVKTAYIPGFDGFAIKVSPGFFDNPKLGLPSHASGERTDKTLRKVFAVGPHFRSDRARATLGRC